MANRQYGRNRGPAASRSQTPGRTARAVPAFRSPADSRGPAGTPAYKEPEVRRWPHPLADEPFSPAPAPEPTLHYIRCALSYQNQMLADIKALLERLEEAASQTAEAGQPDKGQAKP